MNDRYLFSDANSDLIGVGVGEVKVSRAPNEVLVVNTVDCCVALLAHDPARGIAGALHFILPAAELSEPDANERPGLFCDTGIPLLLEQMGANSPNRLVFKAAGATSQRENDPFDVGRRNHAALRDQLKRFKASLSGAALGGNESRMVRFHVGTGRVFVRSIVSGRSIEI